MSKFVAKFRKERDSFDDYKVQKKQKSFKQNKNLKHFTDMDYAGQEMVKMGNKNKKSLY